MKKEKALEEIIEKIRTATSFALVVSNDDEFTTHYHGEGLKLIGMVKFLRWELWRRVRKGAI